MDERDAKLRDEKLNDQGPYVGGASVPPSGTRLDRPQHDRNPNGVGTWVWALLIIAVLGIGAYMWVDDDGPNTATVNSDRDGLNRDANRNTLGRPQGDVQGLTANPTSLKEIQDKGTSLLGRSIVLNDVTVSRRNGDRLFTVRSDDGTTMLALLGTQDVGNSQVKQGQKITLQGVIREGRSAAPEKLPVADARLVADAPRFIEVTNVTPR